MGEIKHHLQNLQQFQSKFEIQNQGPWSEVKTKKHLALLFTLIV
jgi:hypothetical protein